MKNINEFMRSLGMHPDQTDINAVTESFVAEMDLGLKGKASSLAMIPTYISVNGTATDNTPVIAIDAGGTNLRIGLVTFQNGKPITTQLQRFIMPGSQGEVTTDEFFSELAEKILPLTEFSDKIGFCFSYPVEIFENHDGKILSLTKEVRVKDAEGVVVGEALKEKLREKGVTKSLGIVVLNDTVACLMGGMAQLGMDDADGMVGLILGTGNNSCYTEAGARIEKLPNAKDMIINCESGNFSGGGGGRVDDLLDSRSVNPGAFRFEKMMSGVYMGKLVTVISQLAAKEGIMSTAFADESIEPFAAHEIDSFIRGEDNRICAMCMGDDAKILHQIVDLCFERAARLVCANVSALCLHCDGGKTPQHPFCLVPEGSMFHQSLLFREKFDGYVVSHIKEKLGRHVAIRSAENSTMAGAALAALLNCGS